MNVLEQLLLVIEQQAAELVRSKFSGITYQDRVKGAVRYRVYEFSKNDLFSDIMRHLWTNRDIVAAVAARSNISFDSQLQVFQITVKLPVDTAH